ncbi:methyltransferase domain-containing protein [Streptomyces sp. NPDC004732]|uniref:glutamine amidotransferase-related protein n=1 Tax=Streptomyces sp. NPDC004732 TaxID=3154290 RepID=UPI0033B6BABB
MIREALPYDLSGHEALVVMDGPMSGYSDDDFPTRQAELALLRSALDAQVPVLGVCLGAHLLALAAGGTARAGEAAQVGWGPVRLKPAADRDPLFAGVTEQMRVLHWHGDTMELPEEAVLLASTDRYPIQAFRVGTAAWGIQFHPEADVTAVESFATAFPEAAATAPRPVGATPAESATPTPCRDQILGRFADLASARASHTSTRAFFTPRADSWEERFAADEPSYEAAVARMGLGSGQRVLDLGCGTGRALPALRADVGDMGMVAAVDAVFSAGLLNHLAEPTATLREWARVTAPGGSLQLFHPSGRAERAARHGRPLDPDDPLEEANLRHALRTTGWEMSCYEDAERHFLARAVRVG